MYAHSLENNRKKYHITLVQEKKYFVFECPKKDQYIKKNGDISFQKGKGWTNPCSHLKTCLCHGKMLELYDIYKENMDRKQHDLSDFFTPIVKMYTTEQAMYDWIELILEESLPMSITKKKTLREFKKDANNVSQEKLKETLYNLVELVESQIGYQMKKPRRGKILHDGWSKNGVHYVSIYVYFMKEVSEYRNKVEVKGVVPELVLLACSPMTSLYYEEKVTSINKEEYEEDDEEAVKFTAEVHANLIKENFKYNSAIDYCKWIKAQTEDNAAVNKQIAEPLKLVHIPCNNHLLNSEVNYMTHRLPELRQIL